MFDEYIERPSLQSIGLGSSRAEPDRVFVRFDWPVAVSLCPTTCIPLLLWPPAWLLRGMRTNDMDF